MKKIILILILWSLFVSCEKDNICIDETTPHLIIRFYDKNDGSKVKKATNLKVEVTNSLDELVQIASVSSTDSITLPLNVDLDYSKIIITKNVNDTSIGIQDEFVLNYARDDFFVSRSCGYKTVYKEITTTDITTNWIDNIALQTANIDNENQAHIKIFH